MKKLFFLIIIFTLVSIHSYAESSRKVNIMVGVGGGRMDNGKNSLLPNEDLMVGDVTGIYKINNYIGLAGTYGMMRKEQKGTVNFPVPHKEKYTFQSQYFGAGIMFGLPLTYIDVYTSIYGTYNMNKIELKSPLYTNETKKSDRFGYIINGGLIYYIGNLTIGAKYQYSYAEFRFEQDSGDKYFHLPVQSVMGTIGFSF